MKLIIVRHGEAEKGSDDSRRNLTDQGRIDIAAMSGLIRSAGWLVTEVRTSPVLRARQTADIISDLLGVPNSSVEDRLAPGTDPDDALSMLNGSPNSETNVWVFHAPDVASMAAYLTGMPESGFYFSPGTMMALNLRLHSPKGRAMLIWTLQPEFLRNLEKEKA